MAPLSLTTTLSELNRLYGTYVEATNGEMPNSEELERAWINYEAYARRYFSERGLEITPVRRGACR